MFQESYLVEENRNMAIPLDYSKIKQVFNGPQGMNVNPFFGKCRPLSSPGSLDFYQNYYDLAAKRVYTQPYVTTDGCTRRAGYFLDMSGNRLTFEGLRGSLNVTHRFFHVDSVDGAYLVSSAENLSLEQLCAESYRLLAGNKCPATRGVEASDRHVHWVWFRRTPTWRVYDEIILRAASWIELNPGYTFHLWTNLKDDAELADFLADLTPDLRDRYFSSGAIRVHYDEEFAATMFDWLATHVNEETQRVFRTVWSSPEKQDTVMKTDYSRNILLAVFGGIYTDFNDLVCLTSIEPLLQTHAGNWMGVTDNLSDSNASNYFMYAGAGNPEWAEITMRCTETLPEVYSTIHCRESFELAKSTLASLLEDVDPVYDAIQRDLDACPLKSPFIQMKHWFYTLCGTVEFALRESDPAVAEQIRAFLRPNAHNRMKPRFINDCLNLMRGLKSTLRVLLAEGDMRLEKAWRFMRTDMYLNTIMHRSNLPIYCRQTSRAIYMLPFSYLLRYACLFSFVGHLGDGSSYGMDPSQQIRIKKLLGKE